MTGIWTPPPPCCSEYTRCPRHAAEYAIKTMTAKGWAPLTEPNAEAELRELGIDVMQWIVGATENNRATIKGNWAEKTAVLIAQTPLKWEIRRFFILLTRSPWQRTDIGIQNFLDSLWSALRLGGKEAVGDLLLDAWAAGGVEFLKALGKDDP